MGHLPGAATGDALFGGDEAPERQDCASSSLPMGRYQVVGDSVKVKEVDLADAEDRYIIFQNPEKAEAGRRSGKRLLRHSLGSLLRD